MNTSHTPAPWIALPFGPDGGARAYGPACYPVPDTWENARLIAAAPELLAALRGAVSYYPEDIDAGAEISGADLLEWFAIWRESALAAIAKAEGRS